MPTTTERVPFTYRGKRLTYHPLCLAFPAMSKEELQQLAHDIKQRNRLLQSVVIYRGKILDGRNRLNACQIAGVKPTFVEWDGTGSLTAWVIAANMNWRHLTSSQKAAVALTLLPHLESEAKQRQRFSSGRGKKGVNSFTGLNGRATEIAAKMTGSNFLYVSHAKSINEQAPELIEEVRTGRLSIADAKTLVGLPKPRRQKVLRRLANTGTDHTLKRVIREAELDSLKSVAKRNGKPTTARRGSVELCCGNCLDVMPERVASKSVSVVVTSPPFNLNVKYNTYKDDLPEAKYLGWLEQVFKEIRRVLRDDGSFFLNIGSSRTRPWNAMRVAEIAGKSFVLQNEIVWVKAITVDGQSHGHFTPLAGDRYLNHSFESIYHFTKTGKVHLDRLAVGVPYQHDSNLLRNSAPGNIRCGGDVWFIPYETVTNNGSKGYHPAVFPVELAQRCIKLAGVRKNTLVLDPFAGIGSTLIAAQELGVKGLGIESDPAYVQTAKRNLAIR